MLRFRSLGSGSGGNATLVEAKNGHTITRVLVDAGFTLKELRRRLANAGLSSSDVDAIFVTHEHGDHVGCACDLALSDRIPLWMSAGTHVALGEPILDGMLHLASDQVPIATGDLQLVPFTVPHDAREPLQLVCTDGSRRLGLVTDLGHVTEHVLTSLSGCTALLIECNHDKKMLDHSNYPPALKRRVGGLHGHLSNTAAAQAMGQIVHASLGPVVAAHLSQQNNRPELACGELARALGRRPEEIDVADQEVGTGWVAA